MMLTGFGCVASVSSTSEFRPLLCYYRLQEIKHYKLGVESSAVNFTLNFITALLIYSNLKLADWQTLFFFVAHACLLFTSSKGRIQLWNSMFLSFITRITFLHKNSEKYVRNSVKYSHILD
jgi:hypothetical protein